MAKRKKKNNYLVPLLIAFLILSALLLGFLCFTLLRSPAAPTPTVPTETVAPTTAATEAPTPTETEPPETTLPPEPEHVVSTASILSIGDLLMHSPLITDGRQSDGSYDFGYIFPYLKDYAAAADFAVANLETTLGGSSRPYQGNPMFNCPDEIVDAARDAGFDMLLTANNHCYDTQQAGYERTLNVVREKGLLTLGTMLSADEPKYTIQEINGIKIGFICYTYEDSIAKGNYPALNYNPMTGGSYNIINCFRRNDPSSMYPEMEQYLAEMKEQGAEATVLYIHWGEEYKLSPVAHQKAMAQKLCDLGVDVIIGGHPHVVEPVELLTSTEDPTHKTVCLYSMGNAVSNQRQGKLQSITTAHTEDGAIFNITFSKYSDGTVYLENVDVIPSWVHAVDANGNPVVRNSGIITQYIILPLEDTVRDSWQERFCLTDSALSLAEASWQRTMDIVGEGLSQSQQYLAAQKEARENHFLEMVMAAA